MEPVVTEPLIEEETNEKTLNEFLTCHFTLHIVCVNYFLLLLF